MTDQTSNVGNLAQSAPGIGGLASRLPARHGPPHPLGDNARCFPCTRTLDVGSDAADSARSTSPAAAITVENARVGQAFQSGQVVHGTVTMTNGGTGVLLMRAFVEARTLYWSFEPVLSRTASLPKGGMNVKVRLLCL